jgi:ATP-dependent Lon protease
MRDFRDAKAMAQTLRDSLTTKAITISHGESLELVSKMLGVADWNTLSALLQTERSSGGTQVFQVESGARSYPAIPLRDLVPFPTATFPLFVGREKSMLALDHAFERQREVVLAVQRNSDVDEPGFEDVYEIGVLAQLVEVRPLPDRTLQVMAQARRRVVIRRFFGETGAFQADINDLDEGPIPDAPFLIKRAATRFESFAAARGIPKTWPALDRIRDPGRVADLIAAQLALPISDKQDLLATLDPVTRLERVDAFLDVSALPPSQPLEATTRRALELANRRRNLHATLEHLLLALIEDADASAVMAACNADLGALRADLLGYLDNGLKDGVLPNGAAAKPTAAFERVLQSAALHARELGRAAVTGANVLMAIFPESRSPAARVLGQRSVSRERVAELVARDDPANESG